MTRGKVGDKSLTVSPSYDFIPPYMMIIQNFNLNTDAGNYFKRKVILYGDYEDIIRFLQ